VLANSVSAADGMKNMDEKTKAKAEKQRKYESEIVKVRYINYRGKNERLSKPYMHWAGDPIQMWHFIPDQEYEVPRGLVLEVNDKAKRLPKRSEILDVSGKPTLKDAEGERIHEFVAVGF
jgi:hypothetical protein